MEKEFVTYEIALALKELDFNEKSRFGLETSLYTKEGKHTFYANYGFMGSGLNDDYIYAPLWQQTIDWFRETYNIHIWIYYDMILENSYYQIRHEISKNEYTHFTNEIESNKMNEFTYKQSREQAILKSLKLCQKK